MAQARTGAVRRSSIISLSTTTSPFNRRRYRPEASYAAKYQRRVQPAKGEIVGHEVLDRKLARLLHDVVERCAARIDLGEIGGVGKPAIAHHGDRQPRLDRAASAKRMSEVTFQRMERHARTIDLRRRLRFRDIACVRCCAMATDEAD